MHPSPLGPQFRTRRREMFPPRPQRSLFRRYRGVLSSTIGCYFVKPVEQRSDTQGGDGGGDAGLGDDGDAIKVLRPSAEKLCFPAARSLALEPRLFLVAHRPIPTCTTAPARHGLTHAMAHFRHVTCVAHGSPIAAPWAPLSPFGAPRAVHANH